MRRIVPLFVLVAGSLHCARGGADSAANNPHRESAGHETGRETGRQTGRDASREKGPVSVNPFRSFLEARTFLERARLAQGAADFARAHALAHRGIEALGESYATPDIVDDTQMKLAAADALAARGELDNAASTSIRMLEIRLRLYEDSHPGAASAK